MNKTLSSYHKRLNIVLDYIDKHLDEEISLEKLAKIAFFSKYHFHRIFSGMTGQSVMSYIKRLKLQRAAGRLIYSNQSVTDIAFDAGFETLEAFIRSFKKMYSKSPLQYKKLVYHSEVNIKK
jgi:AraC family transcriptional regulator